MSSASVPSSTTMATRWRSGESPSGHAFPAGVVDSVPVMSDSDARLAHPAVQRPRTMTDTAQMALVELDAHGDTIPVPRQVGALIGRDREQAAIRAVVDAARA